MQFEFDNVNEAFYNLVEGIDNGAIPTERVGSRVGDVLQVMEPVIVTYKNPRQRVLFNTARDCNPFFHLFESLWMLAGRNDVAPLAFYSSKIADIASDDGVTFNGAYGYRWRHSLACMGNNPVDGIKRYELLTDQLEMLIEHLSKTPTSRRAVLQMWNVEDDLLKVNATKDVCCNTCVYFSIRKEFTRERSDPDNAAIGTYQTDYLDMTVCNRSNDLILGMLGANVVHFSYLQEYMASCLRVNVGKYHQFTNNMHTYVANWKPKKWLEYYDQPKFPYPESFKAYRMVEQPELFDREVAQFIDRHSKDSFTAALANYEYGEPFLNRVAQPMCQAFAHHKRREYREAKYCMAKVDAADWQKAGREWLAKREQWYSEPYRATAERTNKGEDTHDTL